MSRISYQGVKNNLWRGGAAALALVGLGVLQTAAAAPLDCNTIYAAVGTNPARAGVASYLATLSTGGVLSGAVQLPASADQTSTTNGGVSGRSVTAGFGVDPVNKRIYYVDGYGGTGYNTAKYARLYSYDGATFTRLTVDASGTPVFSNPTTEHQAGVDEAGTLWATDWAAPSDVYQYSGGTVTRYLNAIAAPTTAADATEWNALQDGDMAFDGVFDGVGQGRMWFVSSTTTNIVIYMVTRTSATAFQAKKVASFTPTAGAISATTNWVTGAAFGPDGLLYISTSGSDLYKFNTVAGTLAVAKDGVAAVSGQGAITDLGSCSYPKPDLAVTKTHSGSFQAAQTGTYTITVTNNGQFSTSLPILLKDALPSGMTFASASSGGGTVTGAAAGASGTIGLTFTPSTPIVPGGSRTITLTVNVAANATSGTNYVSVGGGGDPVNGGVAPTPGAACTSTHCASDPTTVIASSDLAIDKSVSASAVGSNGSVAYTLRVWNNGPSPATAATVKDPLPTGLMNATVVCTAAGTAVCGTQSISGGTLTATTGSVTLDTNTANTGPDGNYLTYTITATAPASGLLSNTAGVTADPRTTNDATPGNDTSSAAVTRVIDAVNDSAVSFAYGAGGTINVLGNDTVSGVAATTGNAAVTISNAGGLTGLTVNGGQVIVPTSATPGTYTVTYSLCDASVTAACDTATVTVTVTGPTAGNPFVCDGTLYQIKYLSTGGTNNSQLFRIVRSTSPYTVTQIGAISPLQTLNGLGYNVQDNYLYALASTTSATTALYRIGQSNAESLGPITLRTGGTLTGYAVSAGTIDGSGTMYLMPQGTTNTLYKVNLSTREATPVPLTYSGGAVPQFGDFAIHPRDGKLYGLGVNGDTTLYIVDLSTGTVTSKALAGTLPSGASFGTVFFDAVGELYGYTNTGAFFHVNTATGAATQLSTADATNTSDGASCVYRSERLDVVKQAGTVTHPSNLVYTVPYTATFKNTGTVSVAGVQITDILSSTFAAGSPTITVTSAPSVTAGGCTANSAFDGSADTRLLTGADTLAVGASCTVKFTVQVQYPSVASIPTAPLNNSMYASGAYDSYSPSQKNGGYVVVNGMLIPPPNVSLLDTSTNGATLPPTANGDTPSPTPVTLPRTPTVTLGKLVRNIGASLSSTSGTFGTSATGKPGDYLEYCIAYGNSGTASALNMSVEDTVAATGPANVNGYGSGLGVLFADGATLASGATAAPSGTTLTSAADGDKATLTATSLNFNVGSLAAGGGGVVCFKAQVP